MEVLVTILSRHIGPTEVPHTAALQEDTLGFRRELLLILQMPTTAAIAAITVDQRGTGIAAITVAQRATATATVASIVGAKQIDRASIQTGAHSVASFERLSCKYIFCVQSDS